MNAAQALQLTKQSWKENEKKWLTNIVGFQEKIESACKEGRAQCPISVIPAVSLDFISAYFEELGYYVFPSMVSPSEFLITLNWKNLPTMSAPYLDKLKEEIEDNKEQIEIEKMLEKIE